MDSKFDYCMQILSKMENPSECSLAAEYLGTNAFKYPNPEKLKVESLLRSGLQSDDLLIIEGCLIGLNAMLGTFYPDSNTIEAVYEILGTTKNNNLTELAYAFVNRISEDDD